MNTKFCLTILSLAVASLLLSQCRTTRGLGQDIEHLGNRIENRAAAASPY